MSHRVRVRTDIVPISYDTVSIHCRFLSIGSEGQTFGLEDPQDQVEGTIHNYWHARQ